MPSPYPLQSSHLPPTHPSRWQKNHLRSEQTVCRLLITSPRPQVCVQAPSQHKLSLPKRPSPALECQLPCYVWFLGLYDISVLSEKKAEKKCIHTSNGLFSKTGEMRNQRSTRFEILMVMNSVPELQSLRDLFPDRRQLLHKKPYS